MISKIILWLDIYLLITQSQIYQFPLQQHKVDINLQKMFELLDQRLFFSSGLESLDSKLETSSEGLYCCCVAGEELACSLDVTRTSTPDWRCRFGTCTSHLL